MNKSALPFGTLVSKTPRFLSVGKARSLVVVTLGVSLWAVCILPSAWAQGHSAGARPAADSGGRLKGASPPPVASASGILVDGQSGKVLWGKDDRLTRAPASLTKILTALVVLENVSPASRVTITPEARAAHGSRTYAEAGWSFTVEDLLYGLLLSSGNDAAIALAQKVSPDGTIGGFMNIVNRRIGQIGATSTHLMNPHGLDEPGHTTSARDMALISLTAMRNPTFARIVATQRQQVKWGDGTAHSFRNHNKLLSRYPGTIGVKTGYTNNARHTLVSAVRRNGSTLMAVTLGSPRQYDDSVALFDWGFANLAALRAGATDDVWPPGPPPPGPTEGGTGSNLVGDTLRLLDSLGRSSPAPGRVPVPLLAASSLMAGSLGLVAFTTVRTRRRFGRQPAVLVVSQVQMPPSPEIPYVSQ